MADECEGAVRRWQLLASITVCFCTLEAASRWPFKSGPPLVRTFSFERGLPLANARSTDSGSPLANVFCKRPSACECFVQLKAARRWPMSLSLQAIFRWLFL